MTFCESIDNLKLSDILKARSTEKNDEDTKNRLLAETDLFSLLETTKSSTNLMTQ
jgi:hypothetical protein